MWYSINVKCGKNSIHTVINGDIQPHRTRVPYLERVSPTSHRHWNIEEFDGTIIIANGKSRLETTLVRSPEIDRGEENGIID